MDDLVHDAERILRDCFLSFAQYPTATLIDDPAAFGVLTDVPITFFSGIAATRLHTGSDIDRVAARFRARGSPFRWWLSPSARPAELEPLLVARGFRHAYDARGMVADLSQIDFDVPPPRELTVRRLREAHEFEDWLDVFMATFSRPPFERDHWRSAYLFFGFEETWIHYVAYLHGRPVATSSLLMAGDLGGIYQVATLPQVRGRGAGRAVTLAAMNAARDRGARRAVLQSSDLGYPVYRALGFTDVCPLRLYDWKPEYA